MRDDVARAAAPFVAADPLSGTANMAAVVAVATARAKCRWSERNILILPSGCLSLGLTLSVGPQELLKRGFGGWSPTAPRRRSSRRVARCRVGVEGSRRLPFTRQSA